MTNVPPSRMALESGQAQPSMLPMTRREYCDRTGEPARGLWRAYAVPKAMRLYDGTLLAPRYRGNAFVALRGSWNRGHPTEYLVLRISFDERGQPQAFDESLTGFVDGDGSNYYGRSVGIAIAPSRPTVLCCGRMWRCATSGCRR